MNTPEDKLRKRIKNLRWGRWFAVAVGCFQFFAAVVVYRKGKKISELAGSEEYGLFFRGELDVNGSYPGSVVLAENLYSTAVLHLGSSLLMGALAISSFFVLRRESELLKAIESLKQESMD